MVVTDVIGKEEEEEERYGKRQWAEAGGIRHVKTRQVIMGLLIALE